MAYIYDIADTWAASGTTFTGIKLNVTNTASASGAVYNKTGSALLELQTNGDTKFWVGRDGGLWLKTSEGGGAGRSITGIGSTGVENWKIEGNGTAQFTSLGVIDFLAATRLLLSNDAILVRDAANTLAQRNGVNAQAFNLYNTYTDASNYERGFMRFASNVLEIGTEKAGTGSNRNLLLGASGLLEIKVGGSTRAVFFGAATQFNSDVLPFTSGSNDLGSTTIRWKNIISLGYTELREMTAPAAPAANDVRIYAEDDGAGKTRLMARFATGAAVQIAIEP